MVIQVPTSSDKLMGPRPQVDCRRQLVQLADKGETPTACPSPLPTWGWETGTHLNPITPSSVSQWEGSLRGAVVVVVSPSQLASSSLQRMHCTAPCMHARARESNLAAASAKRTARTSKIFVWMRCADAFRWRGPLVKHALLVHL